jgi:hypothetical protein
MFLETSAKNPVHMQPKTNMLTRNQREILKARHRHEPDKRLCDRIKTILLLDKGRTYEVIAED